MVDADAVTPFQNMLDAARSAFPALPAADDKIYFKTRVNIDTKDYKSKTEVARLTPEAWEGIQPPWGPGMSITEVEVRTQGKWWSVGKVHEFVRVWDLKGELKAKMQ